MLDIQFGNSSSGLKMVNDDIYSDFLSIYISWSAINGGMMPVLFSVYVAISVDF